MILTNSDSSIFFTILDGSKAAGLKGPVVVRVAKVGFEVVGVPSSASEVAGCSELLEAIFLHRDVEFGPVHRVALLLVLCSGKVLPKCGP